MIIKTRKSEPEPPYYDSRGGFTLTVETEEGKEEYGLYTGEPEDMIFGRNLTDERPIKKMLRLAYNAGKNGEDLSIEPNEVES